MAEKEEKIEFENRSQELQSFLTIIKEGFDYFEKFSPNWIEENPSDTSWAALITDHIFREASKYVPKDFRHVIYYGIQFALINGILTAAKNKKTWTEEHIFTLCKELAETGEIKEFGTKKEIEERYFGSILPQC